MTWSPTEQQLTDSKRRFPYVNVEYQTIRFLEAIGEDALTQDDARLTKRWTAWLSKIDREDRVNITANRPAASYQTGRRTYKRGQGNREILAQAIEAIERKTGTF